MTPRTPVICNISFIVQVHPLGLVRYLSDSSDSFFGLIGGASFLRSCRFSGSMTPNRFAAFCTIYVLD